MTFNYQEAHTATIGKAGRIVIPAIMRKKMGFNEGDELRIRMDEEGIHLTTQQLALEKIQKIGKKYAKKGKSVVNEFLAERRAEWE